MGVPELLVILFIILLLFGARKLPDLASGLGGAVHAFKKSMKDGSDDAPPARTIDSRATASADPVPTAATSSSDQKT